MALISASTASEEYAMKKATADLTDCEFEEKTSDMNSYAKMPSPIHIGKHTNNFEKEINRVIKKFPSRNYSDHYLSIVTYADKPKDKKEKEIMQNWLEYIDYSVNAIKMTSFEIIIVDMTKENEKKYFSKQYVAINKKRRIPMNGHKYERLSNNKKNSTSATKPL